MLVFDTAQKVGIGEYQYGVTFLEQASLLSCDAFYTSCLTGIDFDGKDGLDKSFHIYIFHKLTFEYFCHLNVFRVDAKSAGTGGKDNDVYKESYKSTPSGYVVFIADVPGSFFELDVHEYIYD